MVEVGDASLRIGAAAGFPEAAEATARRAYLAGSPARGRGEPQSLIRGARLEGREEVGAEGSGADFFHRALEAE